MRDTSVPRRRCAVKLAPSDVVLERKPDGTIYLRSPHPLGAYPDKLTERLEHGRRPRPTACSWRGARRTAHGGR